MNSVEKQIVKQNIEAQLLNKSVAPLCIAGY